MKYFILEYKTESINYCAVCLKEEIYRKGTFFHKDCGNWLCVEHGCKCHIKNCKTEDCSICNDINNVNNECHYCDELTCEEHINFCTVCDLKVCDDCTNANDFVRCKSCGRGYCEKHSYNKLNSNGCCIIGCM